ncbi:MAG TPA: HlyD family secretion protein [Rhizomicrobium sp.]|jgi:membrane fusion protein (multidrug efflux system)|nr:HlyD family secretion protein [Rhizomicrobium sp.]
MDATIDNGTLADFAPGAAAARPSFAQRLKTLPLRPIVIAGAAVLAMALGGAWIAWPASSVSTDDAYVKADSTIVAPKVHGLVAQILVRDNQHVVAGQPLIRIDPEDYQQDVAAAEADVASAEAALSQQSSQLALASANARAASADIRSADAQAVRAGADRKRFDALAATGDVSRRQAEEMRATAASMSADAEKSRAAFAASQQQVAVISRSRGQLIAALAKARAALSLAKQNLDHSVVRAPVAGVIGDRQVQIGEYVQPGTQLMTIVPMATIYVLANFKETQTARMLVGQKARVSFDALPGKHFDGEVESFAPGSGSEFSLLPYEPATGNFTRIVQRVPVRIHLYPGQDGSARLRPGLSADVDVTLKD